LVLLLAIGTVSACEERTSAGDAARRWLQNVIVNDWDGDPFATTSVLAVRGVERGHDSQQYWFRIVFQPTSPGEVANRIKSCLRRGDPYQRALTCFPRFHEPYAIEASPALWRPSEIADAAKSYEMILRNVNGRPARGVIIHLDERRGIAYLRVWQL
jgi:hypothetical protein